MTEVKISSPSGSSPGVRRYDVDVAGYGQPFKFTITLSDFMDFQREAQRDAAMATNNFLLRTCTDPDRKKMIVLFEEHWGLPGIVMEKLATELVDLRSAALKNSSGA